MADACPTPWRVDEDYDVLASSGQIVCEHWKERRRRWKPTAALIVRAVNAHDDLLNALKEVLADLEQGAMPNRDDDWFQRARAAIAKATQ